MNNTKINVTHTHTKQLNDTEKFQEKYIIYHCEFDNITMELEMQKIGGRPALIPKKFDLLV